MDTVACATLLPTRTGLRPPITPLPLIAAFGGKISINRKSCTFPDAAPTLWVGSPWAIFGIILGFGTVSADDWLVPVIVSALIAGGGVARSLFWFMGAKRWRVQVQHDRLLVTKSETVLIDAIGSEIEKPFLLRNAGSVLFSPNADIATLVVEVNGRHFEIPLWMPFDRQVREFEGCWASSSLPPLTF